MRFVDAIIPGERFAIHVERLFKLKYTHLNEYIGYCSSQNTAVIEIYHKQSLYLLTKTETPIAAEKRKYMAVSVIKALHYLHENACIHGYWDLLLLFNIN